MAAGLIAQGNVKCPNDGYVIAAATETTTNMAVGTTQYTLSCPQCGLSFVNNNPNSLIAAATLHLAG